MARPSSSNVDAYLQALPDDVRRSLEGVRTTLRRAAPDAEEVISYGVPAYRVEGGVLIGFGASSQHCALYLFSGTAVGKLGDELAAFSTSKSGVRFDPQKPPSAALMKKLIAIRRTEIEEAAQTKLAKKVTATKATAKKKR